MSISEEPMQIKIGVQAAEEIMIGLVHRTRQKGITGTGLESEILSTIFEKEFGADPQWFDRKLENAGRTPEERGYIILEEDVKTSAVEL